MVALTWQVRAGVLLGADVSLAFAPQVLIHPEERRGLELPEAPFDPFLRGVHAVSKVEDFSLEPLTKARP